MRPYSDKAWHTIGSSYWRLLGSFGVRESRRATVGASGSLSQKPLKVCGLEGLCPLGTAGVLSLEFPDHWLCARHHAEAGFSGRRDWGCLQSLRRQDEEKREQYPFSWPRVLSCVLCEPESWDTCWKRRWARCFIGDLDR